MRKQRGPSPLFLWKALLIVVMLRCVLHTASIDGGNRVGYRYPAPGSNNNRVQPSCGSDDGCDPGGPTTATSP
ncbi:hypothetical protein E2562_022804 [Oryza meyeriana var. granulata]|uniref:Uncharacterized protein n=1 Tax=Oryza meyeriana var. granulata TaxID=110450 RepID=A0A6G1EY89_9ORYZ|nr:hypothetical protein E2562_022804 [Oryza meyeriana var. granulata]